MRFPELGFYGLPGHVTSPRRILSEVRDGEAAGLGSVWISERHNVKEAATLCGASGAVTEQLAIATGVTNINTRHPVALASFGGTMAHLTGGRFALGFGRGQPSFSKWGLAQSTLAELEDMAGLLRRIWSGEPVRNHQGPCGTFKDLTLDFEIENPPPLAITALGPKTQALAGRAFDAVLLHPLWTDEAVAAAVERVRRSAEEAGRNPDDIQVWACLVVAADLPEKVELVHVIRRATTYFGFRGYGEMIVDANGWDRSVLDRLRSHPVIRNRLADVSTFSTEELRQLREVYPAEWITKGNAVGTASHCAERIKDQFRAGASGVVLHASAPNEMTSLLDRYAQCRDSASFVARSATPGRGASSPSLSERAVTDAGTARTGE